MKSICSLLEETATEFPDKPLFVFPVTRWLCEESLTYSDLVSRAGAAAGALTEHCDRGDRALLMFPTGAAFWEAFFGCLARGVIGVPLNIPSLNRPNDHLQKVCKDSTPSVLMTDKKTADLLVRRAEKHPYLSQLPVVTPEDWRDEPSPLTIIVPDRNDTAFLQYTSGSTARPKGVQVSHDNLMSNLKMIRDRMEIQVPEGTGVTWLPHYHDMGLIGSYLVPLYTRNTAVCLPPGEFAVQPARWLQLISEHKASVCGGPDFGFRFCAEKITDEQMEGVDLSSWRVAYIGAERIRPETIRRFTERFAPFGFRESAFFPCYGLGEVTLMATGGPATALPVTRRVSSSALMENRIEPPGEKPDLTVGSSDGTEHSGPLSSEGQNAVTEDVGEQVAISNADCTILAGSGRTSAGCKVAIVDGESDRLLPDNRVGEVFLAGQSVTRGYYNSKELNEDAFRLLSVDGQRETFLRTGDLGFLSEGELFITGRIREIIIIRGRNLYPDDIEQHIDDAHEALAPGGSVAFSVDQHDQESLILVAELQRSAARMVSHDAIFAPIRQRVIEAVGVNPAEILLMRPLSIPRTSSGKLKRVAARESYIDGTISCLARELA
ncbi:MAG: fatty acyl-AMP ligase [Fuerstiella sp.]